MRSLGARTVLCTPSTQARVHAFAEGLGSELGPVTPLNASALLQVAREVGAHRVAIDSYDISSHDVRALVDAGKHVLYVDDSSLPPSSEANIVVNPNLFGADLTYSLRPDTVLLAGPEFALLRPEFAEARGRPGHARTGPLRVLVTLGGADPLGLVPRVVTALVQTGMDLTVDVVTGAADPKVDAAREAVATLAGATLTVGATDMADRILRADAVITAAGSTCLEIACIGRPTLAIPVADNQVPVGAFLERGGLMSVISGTGSVPDLVRAIRSLLGGVASAESCARISSQRRLVDGGGASRVATTWLELGRSR